LSGLGYRTIVYCAGSAIFEECRQHDERNRFGKEERFCEVMGVINPRYTTKYDKYDIWFVDDRMAIRFCTEDMLPSLDEETKAALYYGLFICILEQQNYE
jgi:hypothetical protein